MNTKTNILLALGLLAAMFVSCSKNPEPQPTPTPTPEQPDPQKETWPEAGMESKVYLNNGTIQIGIDLERGEVIFHFSEVEKKTNLLNHFDAGRMVQQSYYGNADGSTWSGKKWKYNPVQGGGWTGEVLGKVLDHSTKETLDTLVSTPVHWANCTLLDECSMEQRVYLKGKIAKIHYKFTYNGTTINNTTNQELPACFVDWNYSKLAYYAGIKPWAGEDIKIIDVPSSSSATSTEILAAAWTEKWAAYLNKDNWGVGIYSPSSTSAIYYRVGTEASAGSTGSSCSYIAPVASFALSPGIVYEYDVFLTIGTVGQIRNNFASLAL